MYMIGIQFVALQFRNPGDERLFGNY